jgi:hypothetical protein
MLGMRFACSFLAWFLPQAWTTAPWSCVSGRTRGVSPLQRSHSPRPQPRLIPLVAPSHSLVQDAASTAPADGADVLRGRTDAHQHAGDDDEGVDAKRAGHARISCQGFSHPSNDAASLSEMTTFEGSSAIARAAVTMAAGMC